MEIVYYMTLMAIYLTDGLCLLLAVNRFCLSQEVLAIVCYEANNPW